MKNLLKPFGDASRDWILHPVFELWRAVLGGSLFALAMVWSIPSFFHRHVIAPPAIHMFPERLYARTGQWFFACAPILFLSSLLIGRLLNGGLIFLPAQQLVVLYALRFPLMDAALRYFLPAILVLLLTARAGITIGIRLAMARAHGAASSLSLLEPADRFRLADQWVLPRALAAAMASAALGLLGTAGLVLGYGLELNLTDFSSGLLGFGDAARELVLEVGGGVVGESLFKCTLEGMIVAVAACYEGLRGPSGSLNLAEVVARTTRSCLASWWVFEVTWWTLGWGLERLG